MRLYAHTFLALTLVTFASASAQTAWPRFRGPNGAGISAAKTIPTTWTEEDYNWKVKLPGSGHASPVIWEDRVYCTCADPESARRSVVCLRTSDGGIIWQRDFESQAYRQHPSNGFATATPAVDAAGVVVTWTTPDEVRILALSPDGDTCWQRDLGSFVGPHGSGSSPVIHGDLVILANMQESMPLLGRLLGRDNPDGPVGTSFLVAMDRKTGKDRWRLQRETTLASYSTPCIRQGREGRDEVICTSTSHGITAVDIAQGGILWEVPDLFEDRCVGSPILSHNLVLASYGHGANGSLCAAVRDTAAGMAEVKYEVTKSVPLVPTPIAVKQWVFLWADTGVVTCLHGANGQQVWQRRVGGNYFGSPICVDGRLYCIDKQGTVVVIAASEEFALLGRTPLGEASFATPAVANGVMYLRTETQLFSLGGTGGGDGGRGGVSPPR